MTDQTTQQISQIVERLASEVDDVKAEVTLLTQFHNFAASVDRLEAGVLTPASSVDARKRPVFQYTTSPTSLQSKLDMIWRAPPLGYEERQSRSNDDAATRGRCE
jgi:hypothetical protein